VSGNVQRALAERPRVVLSSLGEKFGFFIGGVYLGERKGTGPFRARFKPLMINDEIDTLDEGGGGS
jgi:hypothetical protein